MVLETPVEDAAGKPMFPDPMALASIKEHGLQLLPRLSDKMKYDPDRMDKLLQQFNDMGVKRILFDGDQVTGFADNADSNSLTHFAGLLNKYGIGIATIENLSKPQNGINKLAFLTDYNVVRLYSLSETDAAKLSPETIIDRFLLAAKDRNIRMFYLNGQPLRSTTKAAIVDPLDNLYAAIGGDKEVEARSLS